MNANATSGGRVVIKDLMAHAGESFDLPLLKTNGVKLAYLGAVNYEAKRREFKSSADGCGENSVGLQLPSEESPSDQINSLQFSLEDPDNAVLGGIAFLDGNGRSISWMSLMTSGKFRVYRLATLPAKMQLIMDLAVPESIQRIPFKIENIPLTR
jgi:hypothetical protein